MTTNRGRLFGGLYLLVVFSLVFSVEFPITGLDSQYTSVNAVDFAIFVVFLASVLDYYSQRDWTLQLTLPRTTVLFVVVGVWIVITVFVAFFRSPQSVLLSILWSLKWFEMIVLFILAQDHLDSRTGEWVVRGFLIAGTILAAVSIFLFYFVSGGFRLRIFFDNPNTLTVFFNLVLILSAAFVLDRTRRYRVLYLGPLLMTGVAILSTGSRGGLLGLMVGIVALLVFVRDRLPRYTPVYLTAACFGFLLLTVFVIPDSLFSRYTDWVRIEQGMITLTDTTAAQSFHTRLDRISRAVELFSQQPVFGYGWFASPSRLGSLDVHYTTLLVELGLIGFVLVLILYGTILKDWIRVRQYHVIGAAGGAWFVSVLAQSVGGNFPRAPQVMFILVLLLAAGTAIANRTHPVSVLKESDSA